jgi:hypothetical protein
VEVDSFASFQSYVLEILFIVSVIGGSAWSSFKLGRKDGAEVMLDTLVKHKIIQINEITDEILPVCECNKL